MNATEHALEALITKLVWLVGEMEAERLPMTTAAEILKNDIREARTEADGVAG